jgi:hypothetical protein
MSQDILWREREALDAHFDGVDLRNRRSDSLGGCEVEKREREEEDDVEKMRHNDGARFSLATTSGQRLLKLTIQLMR